MQVRLGYSQDREGKQFSVLYCTSELSPQSQRKEVELSPQSQRKEAKLANEHLMKSNLEFVHHSFKYLLSTNCGTGLLCNAVK